MADLFADENFSLRVVRELRKLGHDILTSREAGLANQGTVIQTYSRQPSRLAVRS
jgi:hypothetical protein